MNQDMFRSYKLAITAIVAATIAASVTVGNWYLPGIVMGVALVTLVLLKRRVHDVLEDERDRTIAGKAALLAMSTYTVGSAFVGVPLIVLGKEDPVLYAVGSSLLYGPTVFMLLYALLFKWYARR